MINEIRIAIANFLQTEIVNNRIVYLNLWHVAHFLFGIIAMLLIFKFIKNSNIKLLILIVILAMWEVFEFILIFNFPTFFASETALALFYDLVTGFLGGLLVYWVKRK